MGDFEKERMDNPCEIPIEDGDTTEETINETDKAGEEATAQAQTDETGKADAEDAGAQAEESGDAQQTEEEQEAARETDGGNEAGQTGQESTDEQPGQAAAGEAENGEPEKKGFFARRKEKKDKRDQQIEELTDRVRRQMAEFDNFRKRTEKEKAAMYEVGARSVIEKILPVVDNFERGLASAPEDSEDPYVTGMQRIYKQLMTALEQMDVKPIEAVGQEFDPELHNAVMHVDDENVGENIIVEELQKGYKYRDTVVRYSMVKVAN